MGFTMALNQFSDLTEAEFKMNLGYIPSSGSEIEVSDDTEVDVQAPTSVDWRSSGAVTAVKN